MCELTSGYTKSKCPVAGGYQYAIIYDLEDRDTFTLSATKGEISTIAMKTTKAAYKVKLDLEQMGGTDNGVFDRGIGSMLYDETAMLYFKDDSVELSEWLAGIEGMPLGVILIAADENNGVNRHLGLLNGLAGAGETNFAQNLADGKPTTLNLVGKEVMRAPSIDTATAVALLTPAA